MRPEPASLRRGAGLRRDAAHAPSQWWQGAGVVLDADPQHGGAGDVGEAAGTGQAEAGRPVAGRHPGQPLTERLEPVVVDRPHERQGEVPLVRVRPPELSTGLPAGVEMPGQVVEDLVGRDDRDEEAHAPILPHDMR